MSEYIGVHKRVDKLEHTGLLVLGRVLVLEQELEKVLVWNEFVELEKPELASCSWVHRRAYMPVYTAVALGQALALEQ